VTSRRGASRHGEGEGPVPDASLRSEYLRLKGALYDPNTDLLSAAAVIETARAFLHRAPAVGILSVEVDPLGRVETVYGWQVLDRLLRLVAEEVRGLIGAGLSPESILSQSGVSAGHMLVFAPLTQREAAGGQALALAARKLSDRLADLFALADFRNMTPRPAVQIGLSVLTEHPFHRLERQIYRAIDEARVAGMQGEAQERGREHAELKRIILDRAIETLYQPIVRLDTDEVIGFEAFTRGPADSMFETPGILFEYSHEIGMSRELDLICRRSALAHARMLPPGTKLFLNALPASLSDPGFREGLLADFPEGHSIACHDVVLEIADRSPSGEVEALGAEVAELRARGFMLSIDDVGRRVGSLEGIIEMRPDFIKIDDSLIRNIEHNMIKQEMLHSLCHAAGQLCVTVIVEGIETHAELEAIRACGAGHAQGFLFAPPSRQLPAARGARGHAGM